MDDSRALRRYQARHRIKGHDLAALAYVTDRWAEAGRQVYAIHFLQDAGVLRDDRQAETKYRRSL
jgi:hypothetical protein